MVFTNLSQTYDNISDYYFCRYILIQITAVWSWPCSSSRHVRFAVKCVLCSIIMVSRMMLWKWILWPRNSCNGRSIGKSQFWCVRLATLTNLWWDSTAQWHLYPVMSVFEIHVYGSPFYFLPFICYWLLSLITVLLRTVFRFSL